MSCSMWTSAAARSASVAARSPDSQCQMWLFCLSGAAVRSQDEGVGLERLERVDDDRQRLVVDQDRGDAVGGDVLGGRDDRGDLLGLVHDRVGRQHHLHVAGQRRHPVELVPSRSLPVMTASTPGILSASLASMLLIVAWAYGLRTMSSQSWPGRLTSSMYSPWPRMKRGSSLRLTEWPMPPISKVVRGSCCLGGHLVTPRSTGRDRRAAGLRSRRRRPSRRPPAGSP